MGFFVLGRKPPINNSSFNRPLYSSRIFSITGMKPQHHEHMGSAIYNRVFSFMMSPFHSLHPIGETEHSRTAWILKAHPGSTDRDLDLFRLLKFGRDFGRDSLDKPRFSRQGI